MPDDRANRPVYNHYTNQPAVAIGFTEVPKAPKYNGCTKLAMRKFMDEYQAYSREVQLLNMACGSAKISMMPIAACIDPRAVERICYWNLRKPYHEVTEEDWRQFFASARATEQVDMAKLKSAMSKLKMDTSIADCQSRVMKLVTDFDQVLQKLSMEGFQEQEPKASQEWLINALNPTP